MGDSQISPIFADLLNWALCNLNSAHCPPPHVSPWSDPSRTIKPQLWITVPKILIWPNKHDTFQVHLLVDCPALEPYRDTCDIGPFVRFYQSISPKYSSVKIYALYLSEKSVELMRKKALSLYSMKVAWHKLMGINM